MRAQKFFGDNGCSNKEPGILRDNDIYRQKKDLRTKITFGDNGCSNKDAVVRRAEEVYQQNPDESAASFADKFSIDSHLDDYYNMRLICAYVDAQRVAVRSQTNQRATIFVREFQNKIETDFTCSPVLPSIWLKMVNSVIFWRLSSIILLIGLFALVIGSCGLCIPVLGAALIGVGISLNVMMIVSTGMIGYALGCFGARIITLEKLKADNIQSNNILNIIGMEQPIQNDHRMNSLRCGSLEV